MIIMNPKQKMRKVEDDVTASSTKHNGVKKNYLEMLPFELLGIILDYTPRGEVYPVLRRISKQFYMLTSRRKRGLTMTQNNIS